MKISHEIRRTKASAETDLLKIKGVTGVGVGEKITKGKRIGQACIRVYVKKKQPKASLTKKEVIPASVDGIPTDVIEREFVLHPARMALDDLQLMVDAAAYDPLTGGISIGPARAIGGYVFVGTLGLVVEDNSTGNPMMLSNFHVMCIDDGWSAGDEIVQPGRPDSGANPGDIVGELTRASLGGQVDCAVAEITNRAENCRILDIGDVSGTAAAVDGEAVRKRGRTTALTHGFVDDISLTVTIDYEDGLGDVTLTNQIGIEVDISQSIQIGDSGDSGSVVVNDNGEVIGLYFAGSSDGTYGVANPINAVFSALDVKLCAPPRYRAPETTEPWSDFQTPYPAWTIWETLPWSDQGETRPWLDIGGTDPWKDIGGGGRTPNKRFDDVKNPAGYDTLMETIQETADFTYPDTGGINPRDPRFFNPPGGPGGVPPFAFATPHHAPGARRIESTHQSAGLDEEIEQVHQYLRGLEAKRRGGS